MVDIRRLRKCAWPAPPPFQVLLTWGRVLWACQPRIPEEVARPVQSVLAAVSFRVAQNRSRDGWTRYTIAQAMGRAVPVDSIGEYGPPVRANALSFAGAKKTVLVVDDEMPIRRLIYHTLRGLYRVVEAGDSDSAMQAMGRESVDLVLLDLHLPPHLESPREGLGIHGRIREKSPETPVVIVSSNNDPQLRAWLLLQGARSFLRKPLDVGELLETIHSVLGG